MKILGRHNLPVLVLMFIVASLTVPSARADLIFSGSQAGECCFTVDLRQDNFKDVLVLVNVTGFGTGFVPSGSGLGFAFNTDISGITITDLIYPWTSSDVHLTSVTTGLGTFDYFIDNPGTAQKPFTDFFPFDVTLAFQGISLTDFVANSDGYYFVAYILGTDGKIGLSGISAAPISTPEPNSVILMAIALPAVALVVRKRKARA